ncbi:putative tetratricopeptide-like helical domain-containing protein [Rosa chinensis]|uniref:Putative tetratricopeptide-like helical domain-containing protein n=1 Tax=Rosa chinensis TaxID=74649 RepID=A0A2P6Q8Q7_ROSCH|nr:protein unc-45 homolog A [Rosa chinensis]PRQ30572.1 putative tetratricopeptide-like helical domain-containing protein [Rosa chinensis]
MASAAPANKIERAHLMYREGRYQEALGFYTEALSMAKTKPQKIALHSNRAACFLKLHDFKKAAEECTSVLELDYNHTGALMLRAQTLVTLKEYRSALFDVNRLIELNPSSEVYQNLEARLRTQVSLAPIPESEAELEEEEEEEDEAEPNRYGEREEQYIGKEDVVPLREGRDQLAEVNRTTIADVIPLKTPTNKDSAEEVRDPKENSIKTTSPAEVTPDNIKVSPEKEKGWQAIPKPKGHSSLDYGRWDSVEDDSSEDDDDDDEEESRPQYRFRVKTVGVRPVK